MKTKVLFFLVLLFVPVLFLLNNIFFLGSQSWGDAPHFFSEELQQLMVEPLAWTQKGANFGGNNLLLWISPIMILYGLVAKAFSLSSEIASLIIFYIPGIAMAFTGAYVFSRFLNYSRLVSFFAGCVYLFNTYLLLLIDGGQVGMVLAYGIFPFSLLTLSKLVKSPSLNIFYLALIVLTLNGIADPRVAIITFMVIMFWIVINGQFKSFKVIGMLAASWLLVNLYWVYPLIKNNTGALSGSGSNLELTSALHPLFLFSPHWPGNFFGKIQQPLWYFVGLPLLMFVGLFFEGKKKYWRYVLLILVFGFLMKGSNGLLGGWYNFIVNLPFGFAFRDPSKFLIPVLLFAGLLIGNSVEVIYNFLNSKKPLHVVFMGTIYIYFLFLVSPALVGNLNFILSKRRHTNDFKVVYDNLNKEPGDFRTVWLPERHPLVYETESKSALDGYTLINKEPFIAMSASGDWFNFLHNHTFVDWFRIFGIKYLILSDDPRVITKNQKESENWENLLKVLSENKNLKKEEWGTSFPVYSVKDIYPRMYASNKAYLVVGSDKYYLKNFAPVIFLEDGIFDPYSLQGKAPEAIDIIFNDYIVEDNLTMSFLQKYFLTPKDATKNEWATYDKNQYLTAKYELLIKGLSVGEMHYSKGVSFSTIKNQKVEFTFDVSKPGEYIFAKRIWSGQSWDWIIENRNLQVGKHTETILNGDELGTVLNVVAFVPKEEFTKASELTKTYLTHFKAYDGYEFKPEKSQIKTVNIEKIGTLHDRVLDIPKGSHWIVLNDSYHSLWKLKRGIEDFSSIPMYSMVNGFYVEDTWGDLKIQFEGQKNFRWGIYFSTVSLLSLAIYYLWQKSRP